jgi:ABC-type spermidine/putrescine transport system permease subunit I
MENTATSGGLTAAPPDEADAGRARGSWSPELSRSTGAILAAPFLVMLALYVVYPFVRLVQVAFGPPDGLANLTRFFGSPANLNVLVVTFRDAAIVTLLVLLTGGILAWTLRTTKSRIMRSVILLAVFVPLWMGSVMKIYAISVLLGREGIINSTLQALHITSAPIGLLYTQVAVVLGMTYQLLPYALLPLYVAFLSVEQDLLLAAESLGASRVRSLVNVLVPLSVPGILAAMIINFVLALGFYLTPILLGGATQPFTATFIQSSLFDYADIPGAAIGGLVLLAGGALSVVAGYLLVGKERLRRAITA